MADELTIVLDIGKTMAKLSLWRRDGTLVARETRANGRVDANGYIALDALGIEAWMASTFTAFAALGRVHAIIPVGHGAAAGIVRGNSLVCLPLDYEDAMSDAERAAYEAQRPNFSETGSPALPDGLNLGAQLHRLERLVPGLLDGDALILPWAQYWAWRLSGVAASEVTSLGCHTDLWNPVAAGPSAMATGRGWANHLPPLRRASDILGTISAEWARRSGLPADMTVYCGLHDSNAALLAARGFSEIAGQEATVLSTGTWFVSMRTPGAHVRVAPGMVSEARDCLINVDVDGNLIPSSRFMGGREIEILTGVDARRIDIKPDQAALLDAVARVVKAGAAVLPSFAPGFGPFPHHLGRWINRPEEQTARRSAVSIYAALVASHSLDLIGSGNQILIEGRFAEAEVFVRALASLRQNDTIYRSNAHNDVSYGALRLANPRLSPPSELSRVDPLDVDIEGYRRQWEYDVERSELAA